MFENLLTRGAEEGGRAALYMLDSEGVGIGLRVNQTGFGQRKEMESGFIVLMHTSRMIDCLNCDTRFGLTKWKKALQREEARDHSCFVLAMVS